jgi:septum formation protein
LLRRAGLVFEAVPTGIDESRIKLDAAARRLSAGETALWLARAKAASVRRPAAVIIGCDQILVCDDVWFDKPPDVAAARSQLRRLRGRAHVLQTATLVMRDGVEIWRHLEAPRLVMRAFSDAFLEKYLAMESESLLGSVGAYRLEGAGIQLFAQIEGEHSAILGLPLLPLLGFLRGIDMIGS